MPDLSLIGWDVGGAHVKAAAIGRDGRPIIAIQLACPLWQGMQYLERALDRALEQLPEAPSHAVTMTGEMVDAFTSRSDGVARIATYLVERLAPSPVRFFAGTRGFVSADEALRHSSEVASANWLATATWISARLRDALLIDIGTTTTDIVPIAKGGVRAYGRDDATRLASGELVYTGIVRTPIMALTQAAPLAGTWTPLMAEYFATTADVYRLTGELDERHDQHPSADNGPKSPEASARRLARMVGRDAEQGTLAEWTALARWFREAQVITIARGSEQVVARAALPADAPIVAAGCGSFLAAELAMRCRRSYIDFVDLVESNAADRSMLSVCAPAVATGMLAFSEAR
jgi:probable H4MPT-linked C1 transfer pathway protein